MGVDASLFAVKAKKYYYFDREYNVNVLDLTIDDTLYDGAMFDLTRIKSSDFDRTSYVLNKNIQYWKYQPESESHRASWNESLLKFIQMFPDDTFFIATDHEEPPYWDIAKKDGYTQYQFPEDIPEPPSCHCPKAWCPLHITDKELEEQKESVQKLIKVLEVGPTLNVQNGYLEIANLNLETKKIKL